MLFYTFFKTQIGRGVEVRLKNDILLKGTLESVDQFLNFKLRNTKSVLEQLDMDICAIRGSSVKNVLLDSSGVGYEQLHEATRYRFF